jgi:hypothetical protein
VQTPKIQIRVVTKVSVINVKTLNMEDMNCCNFILPPEAQGQVKVTLRPTISRSVSPGFEPHVGLVTGY